MRLSFMRCLGTVLVALASVAFYFTIIGVFELGPALIALFGFIAMTFWVWRPSATGEGN